jgi:phosphomannomutase
MVTGSHIPADRNGIKFYRPKGEVLKEDEAGMRGQVIATDPALSTMRAC